MQRSKTPPKGAAILVATCLTREPALINDYHAAAVTTDLLGIESSSALVKLVKDLPPTGDWCFDGEIAEERLHIDTDSFIVTVHAGPVRGFASHARAAHRGEDPGR